MNSAEKYITIAEVDSPNKTKKWAVINRRTKQVCGTVSWYGGFRKYVFFPKDGFLFDSHCLALIAKHLAEANFAHRLSRKKKK